jgi:hypothetical protein
MECIRSTGACSGDLIFRFIQRESLVILTILLVFGLVVGSGVLIGKNESFKKDIEYYSYTDCKVRVIQIMLEPIQTNLSDTIETLPCRYEKKHQTEFSLGAPPSVSQAGVGVVVVGWILVVVFALTLRFGKD